MKHGDWLILGVLGVYIVGCLSSVYDYLVFGLEQVEVCFSRDLYVFISQQQENEY